MNLTDIDKVLTGLDCLITNSVDCDGCPYNKDENSSCMKNIAKDALDLINYQHEHIEAFLRDQEEKIKPVLNDRQYEDRPLHYARYSFCPSCHQTLSWLYNRKYCGFCGQAVKWE